VRIDSAMPADADRVLTACQRLLVERYDIHHTTIQVERGAVDRACAPDAEGNELDPFCTGSRIVGAGTRPATGRAEADPARAAPDESPATAVQAQSHHGAPHRH